MSELYRPPVDPEHERATNIAELVEQYFADDKEFILEMDETEVLGYLYGALIETGEDPDVIMHEFGVIE